MEDRIKVAFALIVLVVVVVAGVTSYLVLFPTTSKPTTSPTGTAVCPASGGNGTAGHWTTYHRDNSRDGNQSATPVTSAHAKWAGPTGVDGQVYAEPLVCGDAVFVATENDSVYAINATTGGVLWRTHLGTPVPGDDLPCGDIDPSGITGTPVIDTTNGVLYVVAYLVPAHHVLFGLSVASGAVLSQVPVDPDPPNTTAEQERGALALANGIVYVPFGGLYGDCASYHGWVVGVRTDGTGGLLTYMVPTHREGGIWSPAGISVAANGSLYVATGNGDSTTTFDFGDSVIELSPSLTSVDYFAPTNWAQLNGNDNDLGTVAPAVLPTGNVFQVGKAGVGYLLAGSHLGHIGGQLGLGPVCGGAYGGTAQANGSVLVPCVDGIFDVVPSASNFSVGWQTTSFDAGSPVVTGNVVWSVDITTATLLGFNLTNGRSLFSFPLSAADHFISPAAAPGSLYVGAGTDLYGFTLG